MRQILQENVLLEFSEKEKTAYHGMGWDGIYCGFHRLQMFRFIASSRKGRLVSALMFEVTGLGGCTEIRYFHCHQDIRFVFALQMEVKSSHHLMAPHAPRFIQYSG